MAKKSKDEKRKAKLKERARQKRVNGIDQFRSQKYQAPEWNDAVYNTESAIVAANNATGGNITDRHVWDALSGLVELLENDPTDPRTKQMSVPYVAGEEVPFLMGSIVTRWTERLLGRVITNKDFVGVVRTIMQSVHVHSRMGLTKSGYVSYIMRFIGKIESRGSYSAMDIFRMYAESPEGKRELAGVGMSSIADADPNDAGDTEDETDTPQNAN